MVIVRGNLNCITITKTTVILLQHALALIRYYNQYTIHSVISTQ